MAKISAAHRLPGPRQGLGRPIRKAGDQAEPGLSYLLPILLIGLCIYFGSRRQAILRLRAPRPAASDYSFVDDDEDDDDFVAQEAGEATPLPAVADPIFASGAPIEDRPVKYLLDAATGTSRDADRIVDITRTIKGKGLCSPRG
jgi:hypothetical protein